MVLLQPKLNLKVSQKQILTPGLVQMVSVLALNKLELKDMIYAEMVENPVLEELESQVPLLDDIAQREEQRERATAEEATANVEETKEEKDPFDEIDFGSFFQDYLDPGYRSPVSEIVDKPSFENFLSRPTTLTDHLMWQLGSLPVSDKVREAAELVIGNLNEEGYLIASDEELLALLNGEILGPTGEVPVEPSTAVSANGASSAPADAEPGIESSFAAEVDESFAPGRGLELAASNSAPHAEVVSSVGTYSKRKLALVGKNGAGSFEPATLREALQVVQQMDPIGVAARDLRECLLLQIDYHRQLMEDGESKLANGSAKSLEVARAVVDTQLKHVQNKQYREAAKATGHTLEEVMAAIECIRALDPRPGLRYNVVETRLIEPDVAFVKQGDEWFVMMNEDDVPVLRLNPTYKKLLSRDAAEKDVRNYVKERYKSAIQLIKNIEQRKQTILKVCYAIIGRQRDFLEKGIDELKPMMIKDVAEEIGVHPSTVSRAVANKYVHTAQGVFELRYFFSESVQGPEGGGTSLLTLKRRVKKLIEEEDPARPLTDEQITRILQAQGIQVTRRTVAKYREDMKIPSTHQRRVKD